MTISFLDFFNSVTQMPSLCIITILISGVMFINGLADAPNSIATCVATRCLTPKRALIMAATLNFLGVLLMSFISTKVAETMFNIVNFGDNISYNLTALSSALLAIVVWSVFTWKMGIPSSQSHSLIAGISGAAIALRGNFSGIDLNEWKKVLIGLIVINLMAFIIGFATTKIIEIVCKHKDRRKTNRFFKNTQIIAAGIMSFMNGAQDGQKFIGILFLGVALSTGTIEQSSFVIPMWLIIFCSVLIALGSAIGGVRIIKTVGTKVAKLEKYQGTATDISSAICLFISSTSGIPVSSTHTKSCAIMGVGASRRLSNVNWNVAKQMILTWFITFPGCGFLSFIVTKIVISVI